MGVEGNVYAGYQYRGSPLQDSVPTLSAARNWTRKVIYDAVGCLLEVFFVSMAADNCKT